jgi:putative peptidoglycan lipid II flippase
VGLAVLRGPLVALLFERGAFGETSTDLVAWALLFYALGLVSHAGIEIVARAFYAMHDTKTPLIIGGGAMLLNVGLSLTLPPLFEVVGWLAHGGLALANSLATTLEMIGLIWVIRGRLGGLEGRSSLSMLRRSGAAALLMGLALVALLSALPGVNSALLGAVGIALGGLVYLGAAWALGVQEVRVVALRITQRFTRGH